MRRSYTARRIGAPRVINDDAVLAPVHRQSITISSSLLGILDVCRIPLEDRYLIRSRVLAPVSRPPPTRLRQHHIALGNGPIDFVRVFLQIHVGAASRYAIGPLLNVHVGLIMEQPIGI